MGCARLLYTSMYTESLIGKNGSGGIPYFFVLSGFSPRPGVTLCGRCLESEIGPLNAPIPIVTKGGF